MAFNSKQYSFVDISVIILGRKIEGFRGIKYSVSVEKEVLHGRGRKALSIQSGPETIEGTLMLLQSEMVALNTAIRAANPLAKLTDVSFDIIVTYGSGLTSTTDKIVSAEFTDYEAGMEASDKFMEIELPFLALDVVHGV
jgi:hypothetical protein